MTDLDQWFHRIADETDTERKFKRNEERYARIDELYREYYSYKEALVGDGEVSDHYPELIKRLSEANQLARAIMSTLE